ncbi:MAG: tetratricopeptide repeat protein [Bacteroidales bacterium]
MTRFTIIIIFVVVFAGKLAAQVENPEVRRGNRLFRAEDFQQAELNYRRALEQNPQSVRALYNLASALYRQGRYDEAANILDGLARLDIPDNRRADVLHNLGNARLGNQQIREGIDAYKDALRIRPQDQDTRHNLAKALRLLQEQQEQQQQQGDEDSPDQDQDQDQQNQQDQEPSEQQQDQQQQPTPRPDQLTPEDAQRILDALNQQEREVQEKIDREERQRIPQRPEREW